jgi:DNA-binding CsgD family transcriptional regulator
MDVERAGAPASRKLVEATEALYQSFFSIAFTGVLAALVWGVVSALGNPGNDHKLRAVLIGAVCLPVATVLWRRRARVFLRLRAQPALLAGIALAGVAGLWIDGGWRSSFYLASFAAVVFAAVVAGVRWAVACATITAVGYLTGLAIWGYDLDRLRELNDVEWVVADFVSYFVAAVFVALPVNWLGNYVVRINQILGGAESGAPSSDGDGDGSAADAADAPPNAEQSAAASRATDRLTVREAEIVHLVAAGHTNHEIASRLVLSPRTVQRHLANAMSKTNVRNRTELAMLAVRDGIVPGAQRLEGEP